ncbi:phosphotransferase [Sinorhizobium sp. BG8]|uniref:phosphotransferase n=1 Tax=Sinorhizobium sp. BG8 TaxID=2613773 RepID=UPI00193CC4A7|nr:phosphotransferase [Sinorhizobium sp. BG8]QRM55320.1 phosphotransferase [Sinorhizobium sp. BG8]
MSDNAPTTYVVDIRDLLSPDVRIVHSTRRPYFEKRIVEHNGTYVLYRFHDREQMELLERTIDRIAGSGARVQAVQGRISTTSGDDKRFGNWIALAYLPGEKIGGRSASPASVISLADNLARLHSVEGPAYHALFQSAEPRLPHQDFLKDNGDLPPEAQRWIEESAARFEIISATQLTHGDLYASNILVGEDQSVALIDYELLAHEPFGIELAIALLRPFCLSEKNRKLLLRTYLRTCPVELRRSWKRHGRDFVFAAAARLALSRTRRFRNLRIQNFIVGAKSRLSPSAKTRSALHETYRKNVALIESARNREIYFRHIARAVVRLCLERPDIEPLQLIKESLISLRNK